MSRSMEIIMSGVDFHTADITRREAFAIPQSRVGELAKRLCDENENVGGCVILSTCNRTEVYLAAGQDTNAIRPDSLLCRALGLPLPALPVFTTRKGPAAVAHLLETAAGLRSQIIGDDQIITQVNAALTAARDSGAANAVLEALFRTAVTAAKKVKTDVRLSALNHSAAGVAVEMLEQKLGGLAGQKALVIGNGTIGRLAAASLVEKGADVTVTLREYKSKPVVIPPGCRTILYSHRFDAFDYDIVLSATTSPHFTVKTEDARRWPRLPKVLVDLALPRDMEPEVADLGIVLYNVDMLLSPRDRIDEVALAKASAILKNYSQKFYSWSRYRDALHTKVKAQSEVSS